LAAQNLDLPDRAEDAAEAKMLSVNEGKVCEAIVRRLEEREKLKRANLRWPEQENHQAPVEVVFSLGNQPIALEHTAIEPFAGHVQMEAQAEQRYVPISTALKDAVGGDALFELHMPVNAFQDRKASEVPAIQQAIIGWVKATAPAVPKRPYPDYKGNAVGPVQIPGVPFPVSLYRFEPPIIPGQHFQIRHVVTDHEKQRADRMKEAVDRKFPKLAAWKRDNKAKTIFVLEQNDIQLTNPAIVTETFLPLAAARQDRPDETYLVASCLDPWHAWPILIGDKSYFDIAKSDDADHWEVDPATLSSLTKR